MHRYMVILWSCCQATQCMVMVFDTNMSPWSNGNTYMSEGICRYNLDHTYAVGEWEVDIVTTQSTLNMQNWKFITHAHNGNRYSLTNKYQEGPGHVEVKIQYEHSLNEVLTGYCDSNADPPVTTVDTITMDDTTTDLTTTMVETTSLGTTPITVETTTSENVETTTSENVETTTSENVETTTSENVETTTSENVETTSSENVETTTSENVETTTSENAETTTFENVETTTSENVETTTSENVETTTSENVDTTTATHVDTTSDIAKTTTDITEKVTSYYTSSNVDTTVNNNVPGCKNCSCQSVKTNFTDEQIVQLTSALVTELTVDKKQTVLAKSKRISAEDNRTSAKSIGIVTLCIPLCLIILSDVLTLISYCGK